MQLPSFQRCISSLAILSACLAQHKMLRKLCEMYLDSIRDDV